MAESSGQLDTRAAVSTIRDLLNKSKKQIEMALPRHMTVDRMLRMVMTSIQRNPRLLECTSRSIIGSVIQSAQLGLEIDDMRGEAYLVPFRNTKAGRVDAQLIPGYKGLIKLAHNSNKVAKIVPRAAYEHDEFDFAYGTNEFIHHKPCPTEKRGQITHTYAIAFWKNGGAPQFVVLDRGEIDKHKAKSQRRGDDAPWNTDFEAMAMKTAVRVLAKYVPASAELQTAVALDERAEEGISQDLEVIATEVFGDDTASEPPPATKNLGNLTEQLKQEQQAKPEQKPEPQKTEGEKKPGRLF